MTNSTKDISDAPDTPNTPNILDTLNTPDDQFLCGVCRRPIPREPRYVIATQAEIAEKRFSGPKYHKLTDIFYAKANEGDFLVRLSDSFKLAVHKDGEWTGFLSGVDEKVDK